MMIYQGYIDELSERIPDKDSLKLVKEEAKRFEKTHTLAECFQAAGELYGSENFQIQEIGVLLYGAAAREFPEALAFLKTVVSAHSSWKVQEILGMAFDNHCRAVGYEQALPLIQEWLNSDIANIRRAASEGLRIWTSRPFFRDRPELAVSMLAARREDESEYVRKSVGNALSDISKKHGDLVEAELAGWDLSSKAAAQVYKHANRHLAKRASGGKSEK